MALNESAEMYLETIYTLSLTHTHVRSIDVAEALSYSRPSVSRAVGLLKQEGYVYSDRRNGVCVRRDFEQKRYLTKVSMDELKCIIAEAKIGGMTKEDFFRICEKMFEEGES